MRQINKGTREVAYNTRRVHLAQEAQRAAVERNIAHLRAIFCANHSESAAMSALPTNTTTAAF